MSNIDQLTDKFISLMDENNAETRSQIIECFKEVLKISNVSYNKTILTYNDINVFDVSCKSKNDQNNKIRENIIGAIINQTIPESYYHLSNKWKQLRKTINDFINQLTNDKIINIQLIHKGGRKYNYDFTIIINMTQEYNIEFKFNAIKLDDAPQFVSPIKPSQYMTQSYENYFYDNYLSKLSEYTSFSMPDKLTYMSEIHSNKPKCIEQYQILYYQGCKTSSKFTGNPRAINFYQYANQIDKDSRKNFIKSTDLQIDLLSNYLQSTQSNKIYMMYKNGSIYKQTIDICQYQIIKYEKQPEKYKFIAYTKLGNKINILLRWKNGNGIAFPAFQLS